MHVQVANDPLTARERILLAACATSLRQLPVERVVLARELRKGLPLGALAVLPSFALPQLVVFRQPRGRCAGELPLGRPPLEHDLLHLLLRAEAPGVAARDDEPVVARQRQGRGGGDLGRGRKQCIETREEALALRLARRVTKALRGEEGGDS